MSPPGAQAHVNDVGPFWPPGTGPPDRTRCMRQIRMFAVYRRVHGSVTRSRHADGTLIRWLLENDLVDEMTLLIVPVVLGQGTRLFPADGPDIALDLIESRADSKGVTIQVYRPAGRPQYAAG